MSVVERLPDGDRPAGPGQRAAPGSRRRTVVVGVLLLAVVGVAAAFNSTRSSGHRAPSAAPTAPTAPTAAPTDERRTVPTVPAPSPAALGCVGGAGLAVVAQPAVAVISDGPTQVWLVAWKCTDPTGSIYPSLVRLVDVSAAGDVRVRATLVGTENDFHLTGVQVRQATVSLTGLLGYHPGRHCCRNRPPAGSMVHWLFDADNPMPAYRTVVWAGPCRNTSVAFTFDPRTADARGTTSSGVVAVTNRSRTACAVQGYLAVQAGAAGPSQVTARAELSGPTTGSGPADGPPVVVLGTGQTATAVLDSAERTPAGGMVLCETLNQLRVSLPEQPGPARLAVRLRACDLQVHPLLGSN
jgi:hypothetical protein